MKPSVRAAFVWFTAPLEGIVRHMYLDVKGLVTVAIGNLIDPVSMAVALPFRKAGGVLATRAEITAEWERLKADPHAARMGHRYAAKLTTLRLSDDSIADIVSTKLEANDSLLRARFPEWEQWPADAQLATHSMAWACGPAFRFPLLEDALRARDFGTASVECRMDERGNQGLVPRNIANRVLYLNAAHVVAHGLDPDALYYPRDLALPPVSPAADTLPDLSVYRAEREPATVHSLRYSGLPGVDDDEPPEAA